MQWKYCLAVNDDLVGRLNTSQGLSNGCGGGFSSAAGKKERIEIPKHPPSLA
jgi:hypothetical protein